MKYPSSLLVAATLTVTLNLATTPPAVAASVSLSPVPLSVAGTSRPNVLLSFANSNSMDEDPAGLAVGSASPYSKSEIARAVARTLVAKYAGAVNMGLEAFQQVTGGSDPVRLMNLHSAPYDVSYNAANYDPGFAGNRSAATKRFRAPNVSNPGKYLYYNVNLPFYSSNNEGNAFCYSATASAAANAAHPNGFNNGEVLWSGPWDNYRCFGSNTDTTDTLPTSPAGDAAAGYGSFLFASNLTPTDSDLGQGITDFGRFMAWNWVSLAWFSNGSPGRGYLHIPIADLDSSQATRFNVKLATSQFVTNSPTGADYPLANAGLTPLQGAINTAGRYFSGSLSAAEGGPLAAPPNSCGRNYMILLTNGLPSVREDGTPSSDVASMLSDATAAAAALRGQNVLTYVVGFALPYGVNPSQLNSIAAAGGTGTAYNATDSATLTAQLDAILSDILRRSGAASAVTLNATSASVGTYLYQAKFNANNTGQLLALPIQANGSLGATPAWDAGSVLNRQDPNSGRQIITYKPSTGTGVRFRWPVNPAAPTATELDASQVAALNTSPAGASDGRGSARLDYLRGVRTAEGTNPDTQFRVRSTVLGDIVNSSPAYVGAPSHNGRDSSYAGFRSSMAVRTPMLYVGANDGFLHAFRASDGVELFAYMPSPVFAGISRFTGQAYSHQYFADGSPEVSDVKFGNSWRTVLASAMNAGGRGVFALDITDPGTFNELNANQLSLWEFTSAQDPNLGYVFDTPTIVQLNNGQWAAIFGNGYNNTGTGQSGLFVVNMETGALIRRILTGVGDPTTPNGVVGTTVVDLDGNGSADTVYGGDLRGNLWKFDISASNPADWSVGFSGNPLFTASVNGIAQPITAAPEVSIHPNGGVIVLFGTGQYVASGDTANTQVQSVYGVRDDGGNGANTRATLVQQFITATTNMASTGLANYRNVSVNAVDWNTRRGWYIDLPLTGERMVANPALRNGRAIFTTLVPSADLCSAGGYGWLMEVDYLTGGQLPERTLDTNGDNLITVADAMIAGVQLEGIASSPVIQGGYGSDQVPMENKYMNQSTGEVARLLESSAQFANRRMSWRQER